MALDLGTLGSIAIIILLFLLWKTFQGNKKTGDELEEERIKHEEGAEEENEGGDIGDGNGEDDADDSGDADDGGDN